MYQHLSKLQSPYGFTRWLMTIAHREVIAYSKKHHLLKDSSIDVSEEILQTDVVAEVDNVIKDYSWLKEAIKGLSFNHKEVLILHYWQELSCLDIGEITQVPEGTVKSRLHKARAALALKLKAQTE